MRICLGQSTEKSVLEILDGAAHPSGRDPVTDIQFEACRIIGGVDDCNHRGKFIDGRNEFAGVQFARKVFVWLQDPAANNFLPTVRQRHVHERVGQWLL